MKTQGYNIVIETPGEFTGIGDVKRTLSPEQFLEELAWRNVTFGDDGLEKWLEAHDMSREEAFSYCNEADIPGVLEKAKAAIAGTNNVPRNDVEGAAQGHHVNEMRINQLAENAETMSTAELEQALVDAGMKMGRTILTR